jgi:hypothetical protein
LTPILFVLHNQRVKTPSRWRLLVALLLAQALPLAMVRPAEHIHAGDDHRPSLVHRHAAPHVADRHDHDDGVEMTGTSEAATWIPDVFVNPPLGAWRVPAAVISPIPPVAPPRGWTAWRPIISAQPHGPPGQSSKGRAPPSVSL